MPTALAMAAECVIKNAELIMYVSVIAIAVL